MFFVHGVHVISIIIDINNLMKLGTISTWVPLLELRLTIQMVFYIHDFAKKT